MKLATLRDGSRDGRLLVVRRDGEAGAPAPDAWPTLQRALDDWTAAEPALRAIADRARPRRARRHPDRSAAARRAAAARVRVGRRLGVPQPRASSCARRAAPQPPPTLETDPLIYQGGSGDLLGPRDAIELHDPAWGLDYESEVCVDPRRHAARHAPRPTRGAHVRLVMLANDCTLRNLVPDELAKGFGFFQSKPATAFSPFAVTPDELGDAWHDGRLHVPRALDLQRERDRRLRRRPRDALLVLRSDPAHREDAPVHRRHDPRQRHGVERRSRARRVVPRRAPDDRDHRDRQAGDAVHGGRRSHRDRGARRRRREPVRHDRSARGRGAEASHEARPPQLLAQLGEPPRADRARPQAARVRVRRRQHRAAASSTPTAYRAQQPDGAGADARDHRGRRHAARAHPVAADPRVPRRALARAADPAARSVPARARARRSPRSSTPGSSRCRT